MLDAEGRPQVSICDLRNYSVLGAKPSLPEPQEPVGSQCIKVLIKLDLADSEVVICQWPDVRERPASTFPTTHPFPHWAFRLLFRHRCECLPELFCRDLSPYRV